MKILNGYAEKLLIAGAVAAMCLSFFIFWCTLIDGTYYNPPVTYWDGCFGTIKPVYHPGEPVSVRMVVTKTRLLPGVVQWSLVNVKTHARTVDFMTRQTVVPMGYHDMSVDVARLPDDVPPGVYFMRGMATYTVNGLRDISYSFRTNDFHIAARDSKDG